MIIIFKFYYVYLKLIIAELSKKVVGQCVRKVVGIIYCLLFFVQKWQKLNDGDLESEPWVEDFFFRSLLQFLQYYVFLAHQEVFLDGERCCLLFLRLLPSFTLNYHTLVTSI
uniref:Uncharacterized protein n=1 Tax=Cacopsylla melanoneura TaxID=428564 RepID=A0A8D8ZE95_9HEMI